MLQIHPKSLTTQQNFQFAHNSASASSSNETLRNTYMGQDRATASSSVAVSNFWDKVTFLDYKEKSYFKELENSSYLHTSGAVLQVYRNILGYSKATTLVLEKESKVHNIEVPRNS